MTSKYYPAYMRYEDFPKEGDTCPFCEGEIFFIDEDTCACTECHMEDHALFLACPIEGVPSDYCTDHKHYLCETCMEACGETIEADEEWPYLDNDEEEWFCPVCDGYPWQRSQDENTNLRQQA